LAKLNLSYIWFNPWEGSHLEKVVIFIANFEKNPYEVPRSHFLGMAEIFSPPIDTNSKTKHHLLSYFSAQYPERAPAVDLLRLKTPVTP